MSNLEFVVVFALGFTFGICVMGGITILLLFKLIDSLNKDEENK